MGIIWGRNSASERQDSPSSREPSLQTLCQDSPHIQNVYIHSVRQLVPLETSLQKHCQDSDDCTNLGPQIRKCQELGRKIYLIVENHYGAIKSPRETAANIAESFFSDQPGPLGQVLLDGINFSIRDRLDGYAALIVELRKLVPQIQISLTVQGTFPDGFAGPVHRGSVLERHPQTLDSIVVQMWGSGGSTSYLRPSYFWSSLRQWNRWLERERLPLMISLTPSEHLGTPGDYISMGRMIQDKVGDQMAALQSFGQIIIADASYDYLERVCGGLRYSEAINFYLKGDLSKLSQCANENLLSEHEEAGADEYQFDNSGFLVPSLATSAISPINIELILLLLLLSTIFLAA